MYNYFKKLIIPYGQVKNRPYQFTVWLFVIIVFGLAGLWIPILYQNSVTNTVGDILHDFIKAGSMSSFCIAILADGLAAVLVIVGGGATFTTAGIRGIYIIVAISVILVTV